MAVYEFVKGLLVLVVGVGLLSLIHKDIQADAENILKALHVDPAWHYSQLFIEASANLTDTRIRLIALAAVIYAAIRFVETYGLWHERSWAEWFAVVSASIYLPVEVIHFSTHPTFLRAALFFANLAIVIYLAWLLWLKHRQKTALRAGRIEKHQES